MRSILLLIMFCFSSTLFSQMQNFSIDLNLMRFSRSYGIAESNTHRLQVVNGFSLRYDILDQFTIYTSLNRRQNNKHHQSGFYVVENAVIKGFGYDFGAEYHILRKKYPVFFSIGVQYLYERTLIQGTFQPDHPPFYGVNHEREFKGWAPTLKINYRIRDWLVIYVQTKQTYGNASYELQGPIPQGDVPKNNHRDEIADSFIPLDAIGLRIRLPEKTKRGQ